jgi:hypothetical protein
MWSSTIHSMFIFTGGSSEEEIYLMFLKQFVENAVS